jgi:hypothetical protein
MEIAMPNSHDHVRPKDETERTYLEALIRDDYEYCHPEDTFDDMKRRAAFSREDKGIYRDWLTLAAARANAIAATPYLMAAE